MTYKPWIMKLPAPLRRPTALTIWALAIPVMVLLDLGIIVNNFLAKASDWLDRRFGYEEPFCLSDWMKQRKEI